MANAAKNVHVGRQGLEEKLKEWGIGTEVIEHPVAYTVEEALPHVSHLDGMFCKNLFLRDKKKKNVYLFCAAHSADMKLDDLAKIVSAPRGLRFADEEVLEAKLGVKQGSVTVFALINDKAVEVKLILDKRLTDGTYKKVYFHPMVNTATVGISSEDLMKFLQMTGHEPVLVDIPPESS